MLDFTKMWIDAVDNNNVRQMMFLVTQGVDPSAHDNYAILKATELNFMGMLRYLVSLGDRVDLTCHKNAPLSNVVEFFDNEMFFASTEKQMTGRTLPGWKDVESQFPYEALNMLLHNRDVFNIPPPRREMVNTLQFISNNATNDKAVFIVRAYLRVHGHMVYDGKYANKFYSDLQSAIDDMVRNHRNITHNKAGDILDSKNIFYLTAEVEGLRFHNVDNISIYDTMLEYASDILFNFTRSRLI